MEQLYAEIKERSRRRNQKIERIETELQISRGRIIELEGERERLAREWEDERLSLAESHRTELQRKEDEAKEQESTLQRRCQELQQELRSLKMDWQQERIRV